MFSFDGILLLRNVYFHFRNCIFWRFSTTPGFRACDVTHYQIFQIFLFSWTHNAPRIPKMYNIMGLWLKLEELLACKVISILHYKKNKKLLAAEISHTDERWPDGQGIGLQNTYKLTISKNIYENREKSKFQHFQFFTAVSLLSIKILLLLSKYYSTFWADGWYSTSLEKNSFQKFIQKYH